MINREGQVELLAVLAQMGSAGQAEFEAEDTFAQTFLPVPEHARALDPGVTLVVGDRGAGKSELFRAIHEGLAGAIRREAPHTRLPADLGRARWLKGFPAGPQFPDHHGVRDFARRNSLGLEPLSEFWLAYLAREVLARRGDVNGRVAQLVEAPGANVAAVMACLDSARQQIIVALDDLDARLIHEDRWIFVTYDELDTIALYDWEVMGAAIAGLITMWASYARRWRRIRGKLFLRSDLYRRHATMFGADLAKLAANRAELVWSDRNLWSMLTKRMANSHEELKRYAIRAGIHFDDTPDVGAIPRLRTARDAKPLVERMVGPYMGANRKKGLSYRWILDHVRDGRGRVAPRSLVRLIELAAQQERERLLARVPRLLHPTSLRRALERVSFEHVRVVNTHELPWLHGLADRLSHQRVPVERSTMERLLKERWEGAWAPASDVRPPVEEPAALTDHLLELGVLRERAGGRLDAPDLYLFGLGLKRRGGVARTWDPSRDRAMVETGEHPDPSQLEMLFD